MYNSNHLFKGLCPWHGSIHSVVLVLGETRGPPTSRKQMSALGDHKQSAVPALWIKPMLHWWEARVLTSGPSGQIIHLEWKVCQILKKVVFFSFLIEVCVDLWYWIIVFFLFREMGGLLIIITWLGICRFTNIARYVFSSKFTAYFMWKYRSHYNYDRMIFIWSVVLHVLHSLIHVRI